MDINLIVLPRLYAAARSSAVRWLSYLLPPLASMMRCINEYVILSGTVCPSTSMCVFLLRWILASIHGYWWILGQYPRTFTYPWILASIHKHSRFTNHVAIGMAGKPDATEAKRPCYVILGVHTTCARL